MIMDIIDLLDISIAQADQTLSSIKKPKILNLSYNIEYNTHPLWTTVPTYLY